MNCFPDKGMTSHRQGRMCSISHSPLLCPPPSPFFFLSLEFQLPNEVRSIWEKQHPNSKEQVFREILTSKYHLPLKGTTAPWRKDSFQGWDRESTRWDWNNSMYFKVMKCSKSDGDTSEDTGASLNRLLVTKCGQLSIITYWKTRKQGNHTDRSKWINWESQNRIYPHKILFNYKEGRSNFTLKRLGGYILIKWLGEIKIVCYLIGARRI